MTLYFLSFSSPTTSSSTDCTHDQTVRGSLSIQISLPRVKESLPWSREMWDRSAYELIREMDSVFFVLAARSLMSWSTHCAKTRSPTRFMLNKLAVMASGTDLDGDVAEEPLRFHQEAVFPPATCSSTLRKMVDPLSSINGGELSGNDDADSTDSDCEKVLAALTGSARCKCTDSAMSNPTEEPRP